SKLIRVNPPERGLPSANGINWNPPFNFRALGPANSYHSQTDSEANACDMKRNRLMQGSQLNQHPHSVSKLSLWLAALVLGLRVASPGYAAEPESITVDAAAPSRPFPHYWEHTFGSGRAILSLRESYREDLRAVKAVTAVGYVRFHAILHDEVGVYSE